METPGNGCESFKKSSFWAVHDNGLGHFIYSLSLSEYPQEGSTNRLSIQQAMTSLQESISSNWKGFLLRCWCCNHEVYWQMKHVDLVSQMVIPVQMTSTGFQGAHKGLLAFSFLVISSEWPALFHSVVWILWCITISSENLCCQFSDCCGALSFLFLKNFLGCWFTLPKDFPQDYWPEKSSS